MNVSPVHAGSTRADEKTWVWVLASVLVCLAAITRQSLWIDEALTAAKASQADFGGWWRAMLADKASDLQMPLYMAYVWGFAKIFGTGEWALRAANIPWFVGGIAVFLRALRFPSRAAASDASRTLALGLVALTSPLAWYYLDEARPYVMQLGASMMVFAALDQLSQKGELSATGERNWVAVFCFGMVALSGSSLLGMIWAGAAFLCLPWLFSWQRLGELARAQWLVAGIAVICLLGLGVYYLWTIELGARASDAGRTDARNAVFIAYELLGFSGLGPGRLEIRDGGLRSFAPFAVPLALYGMVVCDLLIQGVRQIWRDWTFPKSKCRNIIYLAVVMAAPAAVILGAGWVEHFRVLGRHFLPLLPVVIFVLGAGLAARWSRGGWVSKTLACGFVVLSLVSCWSFRLAARHGKDDYRDAAALAKEALQTGKTVWWNAGKEGAEYYHVALSNGAENVGAVWLMNPAAGALSGLAAPEMIVVSKPDVFDGRGTCADFVLKGGYVKRAVFPAFVIWQKK